MERRNEANVLLSALLIPVAAGVGYMTTAVAADSFKDLMRNDGGLHGAEMLLTQDCLVGTLAVVGTALLASGVYHAGNHVIKAFINSRRKAVD